MPTEGAAYAERFQVAGAAGGVRSKTEGAVCQGYMALAMVEATPRQVTSGEQSQFAVLLLALRGPIGEEIRMGNELVGLIGIAILLVLMFCRVWVGPAMLLVGFIGCVYLGGLDQASTLVGLVPYTASANYTMSCVPMFVFMGTLLSVTGIGGDLYYAARKWIGHVRGGLAMATVGACGLFAAVCGDSTATAVTMGKVGIPEMRKYQYADVLSAGCTAAGGTIGILIPPSIAFIIYGLITEQSIGRLFMSGVIPGALQVLFYIAAITILCRFRPQLGPAGPRATFAEKVASLKLVWPTVAIFAWILISLYTGLATPTEVGAIGAAAAMITSLVMRRLRAENLASALIDTVQTTAMVFLLIVGAYVFMRFMALSHLPTAIVDFVIGVQRAYSVPPLLIIIGIVFVYLVVGCFLDILAAVLLTLPIIYPVVVGLGYDPIWWGVMMVRIMEISMITPPFGLNLFTLARTIDVPLRTVYSGVLPFILADLCHVALIIAIPELSLFLPNRM